MLAKYSVFSKRSNFIVHVLVMATEWPEESAILQTLGLQFRKNNYTWGNFSTFTPKFRFENPKRKIYFANFFGKPLYMCVSLHLFFLSKSFSYNQERP